MHFYTFRIGEAVFFMHNARFEQSTGIQHMNEWVSALIFGVAVVAFVLGLSSIIMGMMVSSEGENPMAERIEYGYLGVSGLVFCLLMVYLLA